MKIRILMCGKTKDDIWKNAQTIYLNKLKHYISLEFMELPDIKNTAHMSKEMLMQKEGEQVLSKIQTHDVLVLLDERGKHYSSTEFANFIETHRIKSSRIVFVIGGAYGFSPEIYQRAAFQISLSKMTFTHQMVRTIFLEQLYRACSIINGEPYHHN